MMSKINIICKLNMEHSAVKIVTIKTHCNTVTMDM